MAAGIEAVAALPDPVGRTLDEFVRPDGLRICKRSVPMGVIAIIYESRPNVTSDAAALALKSGNVCVLRSGREAYRSAAAITAALRAEACRWPVRLVRIGSSPACTSRLRSNSTSISVWATPLRAICPAM